MALDKDEREELLSRQIAETVTASVEKTLRARYSWIGVVMAFVLGGLGYGLISAVVENAATSVTKSEIVLELAQKQIDAVNARTREKLAEIDAFTEQSRDRLKALEADIADSRARVEDRIGEINRLVALRETDVGNLLDTTNQITALSAQVRDLNEQVKRLAEARPAAAGGADAQPPDAAIAGALTRQTAEIDALAEKTLDIRQRIETSRTTVFVQVAGLSRDQVGSVTSALALSGYAIPGVEWVKAGAPAQEVRYFHAEDRAAAERVAEAASEALSMLRVPDATVKAKDATDWAKLKPRPGTVELWLLRP